MELKILQWNVWYKEKPENIILVLKEIDADILCLQELTDVSEENPGVSVVDEITKALAYNSKYFVAQTWSDVDIPVMTMGNGIFSKLDFVSDRGFFIQDSGNNNPRYDDEGRVYGEVDILVGKNKKLTVATTHMSYTHAFEGSKKRDEENRQLHKALPTNPKNYVFCGDLNTVPQSAFIQSFPEKSGLIPALFYNDNTWTTKPFDYEGFKADTLDYRLDYVYTSIDVDVISAEVMQTDVSDHLPILTTIRI